MNEKEHELLLKTAKKIKGGPLTEHETELLKEYYTSSGGSVFNRMRMAMQMVLNIDTSMFRRVGLSSKPVRKILNELRIQAERLEQEILHIGEVAE